MKLMRGMAAGVLCLCTAAGCIESRVVVNINKDGSGTLVAEDFMSPQMTGMMQQFGQAMTGEEGGAAAPDDPLAMFADQIEKKGAELGGSARLVEKSAQANAAGWKGYRLVYAFDDAGQLFLPIGGGNPDEDSDPDRFKIEFKSGTPSVLRLVPPASPKPEESAAAAADTSPEAAGMEAQMAAMMASMFAGMRMTMEIRVDGEIVKSDTPHVSDDKRSVTVFDIAMDKLIGNSDAMSVMMNKTDSESRKMSRLSALKIDGVKVPDTSRPITIEFK